MCLYKSQNLRKSKKMFCLKFLNRLRKIEFLRSKTLECSFENIYELTIKA